MDWLDLLWTRRWWEYRPDAPLYALLFPRYFNLAEFIGWEVCAGVVWWRDGRYRKSGIEVVYGLLFLVFGLTDLREAYALDSWLLWVKLINLIALFWVRRYVLTRYYPDWKTV